MLGGRLRQGHSHMLKARLIRQSGRSCNGCGFSIVEDTRINRLGGMVLLSLTIRFLLREVVRTPSAIFRYFACRVMTECLRTET